MSEMVERVAKAIWERRSHGENWDARLSWYRASDKDKLAALERGAHPDNFTYDNDVDDAFFDARAAIEAVRATPCTHGEKNCVCHAFLDAALNEPAKAD